MKKQKTLRNSENPNNFDTLQFPIKREREKGMTERRREKRRGKAESRQSRLDPKQRFPRLKIHRRRGIYNGSSRNKRGIEATETPRPYGYVIREFIPESSLGKRFLRGESDFQNGLRNRTIN